MLLTLVSLAGTVLLAARLPTGAGALLAALNILAFAAYGLDKSWAQSGKRRIPEILLHLLNVLACAGASLGRNGWRHKTLKPAFAVTSGAGTALAWAALFGGLV